MNTSQHLFSISSVCLKSTSQLEGVQLSLLHYFEVATRRIPQISLIASLTQGFSQLKLASSC